MSVLVNSPIGSLDLLSNCAPWLAQRCTHALKLDNAAHQAPQPFADQPSCQTFQVVAIMGGMQGIERNCGEDLGS
jgi:hypothetical protein